MQEYDAAVLPSAEISHLARSRATPTKAKGKKKTTKTHASKTRKIRGNMADDDEEELDEAEFRKKVQSVFHLPIADAATTLGLGVTVLKKRCRRINIPRWPYRKLASIEKLIESVEKVPSQSPLMLVPPPM
jgi:hypothetical protein